MKKVVINYGPSINDSVEELRRVSKLILDISATYLPDYGFIDHLSSSCASCNFEICDAKINALEIVREINKIDGLCAKVVDIK